MRSYLLPVIGIAAGASIAACALWRRFGRGTYLRFPTMFGRARVYQVEDDAGRAVRLLEVGGIVQSGTYVDDERCYDLVFEYLKRYDLMFGRKQPIRRVCVLGCGGYDYPEHLVAHHPAVSVDAVEIDPAITAIARRYFFLDRLVEEFDAERTGRLNLVCADALEFLENAEGRYDAIVNDCFDAGAPPAHLVGERFAHAVKARLAPGGIYLTNIVAALDGPGSTFLNEQMALLERVFGFVRAIPCATDDLTSPDNVIVCASDTGLEWVDGRAESVGYNARDTISREQEATWQGNSITFRNRCARQSPSHS